MDEIERQMKTLRARQCPEVICEILERQRNTVLAKAAAEIPEEHIPFVPVIPRSYLGIYGLMPMVMSGDKVGYTYLNPNEFVERRVCLTVDESIAVCIHSSVLSRHHLWCAGSRCLYASNGIPAVYLCDGRPRLDWRYADFESPKWGTASRAR